MNLETIIAEATVEIKATRHNGTKAVSETVEKTKIETVMQVIKPFRPATEDS